MRDVLVSLKPYFYYLIGEGIKTMEVRKSMPKADDWSRNAWFYMSKDNKSFAKIPKKFQEKYRKHFGKVGLKFVCDRIDEYSYDQAFDESMGVYIDKYGYDITSYELGQTCLTYEDFENYGNTNRLYGWHISNLVIYDEPKELGEFKKPCNSNKTCGFCDRHNPFAHLCRNEVTRPPQSYMFVEELGV
jgi:hypothetical protein